LSLIKHIYISIPFCNNFCRFCNFFKLPPAQWLPFTRSSKLAGLLQKEMLLYKKILPQNPVSIYTGGGTPALSGKNNLKTLTAFLKEQFCLTNTETTIEANPVCKNLENIPDSFFNRISIGIQSFSPQALHKLGRKIRPERAFLKNAAASYKNISVDLIYNIPGTGPEVIKNDLLKCLHYNVKHLSCYTLEGFKNDNKYFKTEYNTILTILKKNNIKQYEISNYAAPGFECRHNLGYWQYNYFLGIGPGACGSIPYPRSSDGVIRYRNYRDINKYQNAVNNGRVPCAKCKVLTRSEQFNEYVLTGLRTVNGISTAYIKQKYSIDFMKEFKNHLDKFRDSLCIKGDKIKLLKNGFLYYNSIVSNFMKI